MNLCVVRRHLCSDLWNIASLTADEVSGSIVGQIHVTVSGLLPPDIEPNNTLENIQELMKNELIKRGYAGGMTSKLMKQLYGDRSGPRLRGLEMRIA